MAKFCPRSCWCWMTPNNIYWVVGIWFAFLYLYRKHPSLQMFKIWVKWRLIVGLCQQMVLGVLLGVIFIFLTTGNQKNLIHLVFCDSKNFPVRFKILTLPLDFHSNGERLAVVRPNPTRFFGLNPSGRVGPQGRKTGPIGSCWPQIGFKFGFNPIMYLINLNEPDLSPISGRIGPQKSKFGLSRVGPPGSKFGLSRVGLVGFIWPH